MEPIPHKKEGNTMETQELQMEILDEGIENTEMVCACCSAGAASVRK